MYRGFQEEGGSAPEVGEEKKKNREGRNVDEGGQSLRQSERR